VEKGETASKMSALTLTIFCFVLTFSCLKFVSSNCPEKCECREERNQHFENIVVDCSHQGLTSIPVFDPEESFSTWKLIMTGNHLGKIPTGAIMNLTSLTELDLSDCAINDIKEDSFAGPTRLDRLILKDNDITDLPEHMFHRHSPALSDLNLSGNKLTLANFIKAGKYLINLSTLNLSKNNIRQSTDPQIPHDFKHLTGLTILDLSHNNLGHVGDKFFEAFSDALVQLEILDLSYNNLRPSVETLRPLPMALEELNLAGNSHLGLQDNLRNTLYGIPNEIDIRVLNLSDVGLSGALQAKAFDFVRKLNLEVLDLSNNRLTAVDTPDLNQKMPYIKELYIRKNRLSSIKSLAHMESLQVLDLSENMLTKFPVEIFHMPELEEVSVSRNNLKRISVPVKYTEIMMNLKEIDLSRNKISTLLVEGNQQLWKQFPSLRLLDVSFNFLSNVDPMNMGALGELEVLDIRHNRFSQIVSSLYTLIGKLRSLGEVRIKSNPFQCTCRWLKEAERRIPSTVMITGLASTVCRTDLPKTHAPTVAGFADATCEVHLPGTPKATKSPKLDPEEMKAEASKAEPNTTAGGLSSGVTALIVIIVLAVIGAAIGLLAWKQGHLIKGRLMGGQMSYTEILDEYHPPNGGGVPL